MENITIVGAGPAGLQTAIKLRELGFSCEVIEEHGEVGVPENCSGLISKKGLDDLKIDVSECLQNEIKGARIYSPWGTMLEIKRPSTVAYVVNRSEFDKLLLEKAINKGINVQTNTKLIDVRGKNLFLESNGRGELKKADLVIGADGVNSKVRQLMGVNLGKEKFIQTMQGICTGNFDKTIVEVYLLNEAKGYFGWSIPINKKQSKIGMGSILGNENSTNISDKFDNFVKAHFSSNTINEVSSALIPYGEPLETIYKNNLALVGDSAFQTKATTGGGIIFGMKSANVLAQTIAENIKNNKPLINYYSNLQETNKELKMHWKIRQYFNSLTNEQIDALIKKLKASGIEHFLQMEGSMDEPSHFIGKMAMNPRYWFMAKTLIDIART